MFDRKETFSASVVLSVSITSRLDCQRVTTRTGGLVASRACVTLIDFATVEWERCANYGKLTICFAIARKTSW